MQSQYREAPRPYTFDDPTSTYASGHPSHHSSSDFSLTTPAYPPYDPSYYIGSTHVGINDVSTNYYRSVTPLSHGRHHSVSQGRYYNDGLYVGDQRSTASSPTQSHFIPTPSDMSVHGYNGYNSASRSPTLPPPERYATTLPYPSPHTMAHSGPHRPRISTSRPRSSTLSSTSPTGERFPCEKCGKTFSRSHDRKRHHETQHLATPIVHRCRHCEKEFSRADSLKRHIDNGCEEAPGHQR